MFSSMDKAIVYLQAECVYLYSQRMGISLMDAVTVFERYHILELLSGCYDVLHLMGTDYLVDDLAKRIKDGVDFVVVRNS